MSRKYIFGGILALVLIGAGLLFILADNSKPKTEIDFNGRELKILNWEEYLSPEVIQDFKNKYNVKIVEKYYEDEDMGVEMINKSPQMYDLVVTSDSLALDYIQAGMFEKINVSHVPNIKNLDSKFKKLPYNENDYLAPFFWGTTGVIVNSKYVEIDKESWDYLFDLPSDKILIIDNEREAFGMFVKYIGKSLETVSVRDILKAAAYASFEDKFTNREASERVIMDSLKNESVWAAQLYSDAAEFIIPEKPELVYMIPEEGGVIWVDNFAIVKDSKNKDISEVFLNYILEPEVLAKMSSYAKAAPTEKEAKKYLDEEFLSKEYIFLDEERMGRLEFLLPKSDLHVGVIEAEEYFWNKIKGGTF